MMQRYVPAGMLGSSLTSAAGLERIAARLVIGWVLCLVERGCWDQGDGYIFTC